jgi:hypothetical protein
VNQKSGRFVVSGESANLGKLSQVFRPGAHSKASGRHLTKNPFSPTAPAYSGADHFEQSGS